MKEYPDHTCPKCGSTSMTYGCPMCCSKCGYEMPGTASIPVLTEEQWIEKQAKRMYESMKPQYTATISTEGATTGPTRLTWETEDEFRREWVRKKVRDVLAARKRGEIP